MGCNESKDEIPTMLCFFQTGNEEQKTYCLALKDNFRHEKSIRFQISSSAGVDFSIQFRYKGKIHKIQDTFNERELENTLQSMYDILDEKNENK